MEVDMIAKWLVTFAKCSRWSFRQGFETCRQSEQVADGHVHKLLRLYVDGRHSKRLLELQAVATLKQHVIDSLQLRPRKSDGRGERKTWFMSLKKWIKCYSLNLS